MCSINNNNNRLANKHSPPLQCFPYPDNRINDDAGPSGYGLQPYSGLEYHSLCLRCPEGMTACNNKRGGFSECQFLHNNSDPLNCGACGNKCPEDRPLCILGQCACTNATDLCGNDGFCNLNPLEGAPKCEKCPDTLANCRASDDLGVERDCETNLDNNPNHCGICNNVCAQGEVCISGKCSCGDSRAPCPIDKVCISGVCRDCLSEQDDLTTCSINHWGEASRYCSKNDCLACPKGFADCSPLNSTGGQDIGQPSDCETNINERGKNNNCGACGAQCNAPGMSCCDGACKCPAMMITE